MTRPVLQPVGQRPRCLHCQKELQPNYRRELMPIWIKTGETVPVRTTDSYARGVAEYEESPLTRSLTDQERKQFRRDHPPVFLGTYGRYRDNRFCGLNCGYNWAVRHSHPGTPVTGLLEDRHAR